MCSERDCPCELLAGRPEGRSPAALGDGLQRLARLRSRTDAQYAAWVAEAERTEAARKQGYHSTTEWLMGLSGEPASTCRSRVAVAEALQEMPATRQAFAAGELSESRVRALAQAHALTPQAFAQQEQTLVAKVTAAPSTAVPGVLDTWKRSVDADAAEAEAERLYQMRALHLSKAWTGMVHLSGDLDPAGGLVVSKALASLSDPANLDPNDPRTPAQARADALVEVFQQHLGGGTGKRRPVGLHVTIPWNTLQEGKGIVDTEAGTIGGKTLRRLACDATISRVLLDPQSVPIDLGKATRVVPDALRRLLESRDKGCTHPGCHRPPQWCDAHHITHWADGGQTDLPNLQLLCQYHHNLTHHDNSHPKRE
jgi:hypothetical protein